MLTFNDSNVVEQQTEITNIVQGYFFNSFFVFEPLGKLHLYVLVTCCEYQMSYLFW